MILFDVKLNLPFLKNLATDLSKSMEKLKIYKKTLPISNCNSTSLVELVPFASSKIKDLFRYLTLSSTII
jgi:hypothetical protein